MRHGAHFRSHRAFGLNEFCISVDSSRVTNDVRDARGSATGALSAPGGESTLPAGDPTQPGAPEQLGELIRQTIDPLQLMQRVADQLLAMVSSADGALVGLLIDGETIRYVCGAGHLSEFVGAPLALQGSLSGNAIRTRRTLITEDTEKDGRVNREATRSFDVRSSICVPLGRGTEPVGVLNVSSRRPCAFGPHDVALLGGLAEFISTVISASNDLMRITARLCDLRRPGGESSPQSSEPEAPGLHDRFVASVLAPREAERFEASERIGRVMRERRYSIYFQPIFDLRTGTMFGAEALARFAEEPYRAPDLWLAEAHDAGVGAELELALLRSALEQLERLPENVVVTLNAGPQALASPQLAAALEGAPAERIVVELTEHFAVEDYPALAGALGCLRERGVRLAIDDAGAGFASLMHILRLAPDFIKLDRGLISGIDIDPVRRSLTSSLMRFAEETDATIIAEGVESVGELSVLDELGIQHAQGFYLARPAPVEEIAALGTQPSVRARRATRSGGSESSPRASLRV